MDVSRSQSHTSLSALLGSDLLYIGHFQPNAVGTFVLDKPLMVEVNTGFIRWAVYYEEPLIQTQFFNLEPLPPLFLEITTPFGSWKTTGQRGGYPAVGGTSLASTMRTWFGTGKLGGTLVAWHQQMHAQTRQVVYPVNRRLIIPPFAMKAIGGLDIGRLIDSDGLMSGDVIAPGAIFCEPAPNEDFAGLVLEY